MVGQPWNNLKAGNLDKKRATLGLPRPSGRKLNSRQYRYAFSALSTTVTNVANYVVIEQSGKSFWLNPASDSGAVVVVHVNEPGNPIYMTPGFAKSFPEGFERLLLERPTQPPVPARSDLYYVIDVSDDPDGLKTAPLPPSVANQGADNYTAPGQITIAAVIGGFAVPTTVLAAQPGRRVAKIKNTSLFGEKIWLTFDGTTPNQIVTSTGVFYELSPGDVADVPYTGGIFAFAQAATATVQPFGLI